MTGPSVTRRWKNCCELPEKKSYELASNQLHISPLALRFPGLSAKAGLPPSSSSLVLNNPRTLLPASQVGCHCQRWGSKGIRSPLPWRGCGEGCNLYVPWAGMGPRARTSGPDCIVCIVCSCLYTAQFNKCQSAQTTRKRTPVPLLSGKFLSIFLCSSKSALIYCTTIYILNSI